MHVSRDAKANGGGGLLLLRSIVPRVSCMTCLGTLAISLCRCCHHLIARLTIHARCQITSFQVDKLGGRGGGVLSEDGTRLDSRHPPRCHRAAGRIGPERGW
jgi:hypothetical protein